MKKPRKINTPDLAQIRKDLGYETTSVQEQFEDKKVPLTENNLPNLNAIRDKVLKEKEKGK